MYCGCDTIFRANVRCYDEPCHFALLLLLVVGLSLGLPGLEGMRAATMQLWKAHKSQFSREPRHLIIGVRQFQQSDKALLWGRLTSFRLIWFDFHCGCVRSRIFHWSTEEKETFFALFLCAAHPFPHERRSRDPNPGPFLPEEELV